MMVKFKPLAASLFVLGVVTGPAGAVTNQSLEASVAKLGKE